MKVMYSRYGSRVSSRNSRCLEGGGVKVLFFVVQCCFGES